MFILTKFFLLFDGHGNHFLAGIAAASVEYFLAGITLNEE
jgi:serine/threonine protein phosphatase PrpC